MEHRLGRTLRIFLAVLAAAGCYRLVVVPLVEPRLPGQFGSAALSPEAAAAIRARADQRLMALADVFPDGAWERDSPIMLESRQMRLLFKDYHSLPDGRVNLSPCTLVVLPDRNRSAAASTAGRTIVMRAPQGAVLEFDEPLDLRQGRLARLIGGNLRGQVTIRGTPSEPGREDEIEIVTRDIMLDEFEVRTAEMVQFRYGRSSGSGRGLVAQLMPRETAGDHGPNFGGVDSIRLDRDVRMRIEESAGGGLLPGRSAPAAPAQPAEPVLVSCRGSLCLNVSAHVITLEDQVDIVRAGQGLAGDRLTCDLLAILLARRGPARADEAAGGPPAPDGSMHGGLEPTEIQAKGRPAVMTSLAAGVEARAERLGYEIATRRVVLDGEEPVSLVMRGSELEARKIDYTPGPPGDPGQLLAVGPGRLHAHADGGPPVRARWQQWLRLRPDGGGHVASMLGAAEVDVESQGRLAAAELHLWLDMLAAGAGPDVPREAHGAAGSPLAGVRPTRLLARGDVEVEAEQAEVRTDRLEIWFRDDPAAAAVAASAPPDGTAPPPAAADAAAPTPPPPAATDPPAARGRFAATASLVRGLVLRSGTGGQLDELSMENEVRLLEIPDPADPAAPAAGIEILGDQLHLARAQRFDARVVVSGRPARVQGRDIDLEGPLVTFDRGQSRFAVDGAGRLALPLAAGGISGLQLTAAPPPVAAEPGRLDVTWQGRMEFDGLTARFLERVVADGGAATVRAAAIDVVFDRPFAVAAGQGGGGPQPEVARIACGGGVRVESESNSADGGRSQERLYARDIVFDRATGDIVGNGPGRLTSTRTGTGPGIELSMPGAGQGPARPASRTLSGGGPQPAEGLSFLGVDFQRGLYGNLQRRQVEFHQRVEAIWGPVAAWSDTLDRHASGGLPARTFTVSCDVLGVGQAPPLPGRPRAALELEAGGNVLVEGESFTARSARLSWSEGKDLLVFAGDGRTDAQLFRQVQPGAQPSQASAGKILFWRELNRVEVEDARFLDFDQLRGAGPMPDAWGGRPAPPRPPPAT